MAVRRNSRRGASVIINNLNNNNSNKLNNSNSKNIEYMFKKTHLVHMLLNMVPSYI